MKTMHFLSVAFVMFGVTAGTAAAEIIDLTDNYSKQDYKVQKKVVPLKLKNGTPYSGFCYTVEMSSMTGSYIDFTSHFDKTSRGQHAANVKIADYYRRPAAVIRPVPNAKGEVTLEAIRKSAEKLPPGTEVLVINALNGKECNEIPFRSIYLTLEAAKWISAQKGIRIVISDTWESPTFDGVFFELFSHGIDCVCIPRKLALLPEGKAFLISIMFLPFEDVVQIPCRILAEIQ